MTQQTRPRTKVRSDERGAETAPALDLSPRLADPDGFYEALINAHNDLAPAESARLNARLILILANQVGDMATLEAALRAARETTQGHSADTTA